MPKLENLHFHFHAFSGWGTSQGPKLFLKIWRLKKWISPKILLKKILSNFYFSLSLPDGKIIFSLNLMQEPFKIKEKNVF